jgi:hypothetical protein
MNLTDPARRPLLNGRRAVIADLRTDREGTVIAYPSDGEFAIVRFDGDAEPVTVHKTRVLSVLPDAPAEPEPEPAVCGEMMPGVMPNSYDVRCKAHRLDLRGERYGHAVTALRGHREAVADGEFECEGHESLAGGHHGETVFCDGTCRR